MVNRSQGLVLGFFALAWIALVAILILAPENYDQTLKLLPGDHRPAEVAFLVAISTFIALLSAGVLRRWRWTFWLVMVAFLLGLLRVPAAVLQLIGGLPAGGPTWYELFQAVVGAVQFAIGLAMLAGYRRAGVWGRF